MLLVAVKLCTLGNLDYFDLIFQREIRMGKNAIDSFWEPFTNQFCWDSLVRAEKKDLRLHLFSLKTCLQKLSIVSLELLNDRSISTKTFLRWTHRNKTEKPSCLYATKITKAKMIDYLMKCNKFVDMNIYGLYLTLQARERFFFRKKIFLTHIFELFGKDIWSLFALSNSQSKVFWYDPEKEGLLFNTCVPKYVCVCNKNTQYEWMNESREYFSAEYIP